LSEYQNLIDRRLDGSQWPEPVKVVRIAPLGQEFEVLAEGLLSRRLHKRLLDETALAELVQTVSQPTDFSGNPELFALGVEARRIELGYTFDPFFAVSTSRIDPLPHQLEAVYGTLLKKPRIRFLLADDPGAGKTVMAGLLLKELKYRGIALRILVVTPANLTDQWRREMKEKFGERFEVVNRDTVAALYDENPWTSKNQVITSVDFAKREPYLGQLEHAAWDLVIVDEAHKLSARRYGSEVKRSQRYRLGEVLSRTGTQVLFLTATPHQGDDEQFRLLLNLLEEDLFANREILEDAAKANENPILLLRLKENMTDFEGKPIFTPRHVHTPGFRLTPSERKLYKDVTEYVTKHFKLAWSTGKRNVGLAMTVLQRRLASSTYAIARSLENRHDRLVRLKAEVQRIDDNPYWQLSEEELEDLPEEERWQIEDDIAERLTLSKNMPDLEQEISELKALSERATTLARIEQDRKLDELFKIIDSLPKDEKLLIFTEHKDTLVFLVRVLEKKGYTVSQIDGSMRLEDRVAAEKAFRYETKIMVATEAAGEGINLQFCSVMVNYDLPWNPTRLEQRMGRIHRYGQEFDVNIYNLVAQGTREGDVLGRLLEKLDAMREQLGSDRVYDVVGELLADVNLGNLIQEHLLGRKSLKEIQAMVDARVSPERIEHLREITLDSMAQRELDLSRLREQRRDSELHRLQPEYVERFFLAAFRRLEGTAEPRQDGLWRLKVPFELRQKFERLEGQYLRATFKPKDQDAEFVAPGHPLFDAVLTQTVADASTVLSRGASFYLPQADAPGPLGYLELAVEDGYGQTVSRKLFAGLQVATALTDTQDEQVSALPARVLVDAEPNPAPDLGEADAGTSEDIFRAWAHDALLQAFLAETRATRSREVAIRRKYGERSLNHLVRESTRKLTTYRVKERQGEDMALPMLQEERRLKTLQERLAALRERLDKEESLSVVPAELIALAHVMPMKAKDLPDEDDPEVRRKVELAAMDVVMAFEREAGRIPEDVSADNVGFDIRSSDRAIEVKGRARARSS